MSKFKLVSVTELLKQPSVITNRDVETAYRRGYSQGYSAATQDLGSLIRAGYTRLKEILNFLDNHQYVIHRKWRVRYGMGESCEYLPPSLKFEPWQALRKRVLDRDGYRCVFCGSVDEINADHIVQVQHGGVASEENLRALCGPCNRRRTVDERQ